MSIFKEKEYEILVSVMMNKVKKFSPFLTPQELLLSGSSPSKKEKKNPHTPILIQGRGLSVLETVRRKRKELSFSLVYFNHFGIDLDDATYHGTVLCSLEDLDDSGKTVRDPHLVDKNGEPLEGFEKDDEFPFPRGNK